MFSYHLCIQNILLFSAQNIWILAFRWTWACHTTPFWHVSLLLLVPRSTRSSCSPPLMFQALRPPAESKHGSRNSEIRSSSDLQILTPAVQACKHVTSWWRGSRKRSRLKQGAITPPSVLHLHPDFYPLWCAPGSSPGQSRVIRLKNGKKFGFFSYPPICPENPRRVPIREPQQKAANPNQMRSSVFIRWLRS